MGVIWLRSVPAWAASDAERAGARAAANEALDAYDQQRWADSLDLFKRAESLVHSPVQVLYIARTEAQLGKLVEAQEAYTRVSRETFAPGAPAAFGEAQQDAVKELSQLEPRIPSVTIVVQGAGPNGLSVLLDGAPFPVALVGLPSPMDPGKHQLKATAPGFASDLTAATIVETAPQKIVVVMKPSAEAPAAPTPALPSNPSAPAPLVAPGSPGAPSTPDHVAEPSPASNGMRTGSYVAFGVGAAGIALGTIFALKSGSDKSDATALCTGPGGACPDSKKSQIDSLDSSSRSAGTLGIVGFAAGAVGVGVGVALFLMSGGHEEETANAPAARGVSVTPWIGLGSAGLDGRFY